MVRVLIFLIFCFFISPSFAETHFSGELKKQEVANVCHAVATWQIKNYHSVKYHQLDWTNATFYRGLFEWASTSNEKQYFDFLMGIGKSNNWSVWDRVYHADDICVGQTWIEMYRNYGNQLMLQPTLERAFYIINHPSKAPLSKNDPVGKNERWSWSDALFMAPPVYAALYKITGEKGYLEFLDTEYKTCVDSLFDEGESLFYRDCKRKSIKESNGTKQFWGRGNGWVFGGLPLIIDNLPESSPAREFYISLFRKMAVAVLSSQDQNGVWHSSLLDPEAYPSPENSCSAFFCYGLAWGIRKGLLSDEKYMVSLRNGWRSLVSAVNKKGKLGYIQPVGSAPETAGENTTDVYGVGAFLLAGSELYKMCEQ